MSYKYGTNGNDLEWEAVTFLNEFCEECTLAEYELRENLKATIAHHSGNVQKHNDMVEDFICEIMETWVCEGHTTIYYPGEEIDIINLHKTSKKLDTFVPWYIAHDTNSNFVGLVGPVPDEYLTNEYRKDRDKDSE